MTRRDKNSEAVRWNTKWLKYELDRLFSYNTPAQWIHFKIGVEWRYSHLIKMAMEQKEKRECRREREREDRREENDCSLHLLVSRPLVAALFLSSLRCCCWASNSQPRPRKCVEMAEYSYQFDSYILDVMSINSKMRCWDSLRWDSPHWGSRTREASDHVITQGRQWQSE